MYPIQQLVRRESYHDWLRHALLEWLPKQQHNPEVAPELLPVIFIELLYAQSWLLMNFLYEYEGGKYRKQVMEFTAASLKGYLGYRGARGYARAHEVFAQIMKLSTDDDWKRLQKEYERHLEAKLYEVR
jgi:hypothetical protein